MSRKKHPDDAGEAAATKPEEAPTDAAPSAPEPKASDKSTLPRIPPKAGETVEPTLLLGQLEALTRERDEARREAEDNLTKLQLVAADYDNFKKFSDRDKKEAVAKERASLLVQFICVLENMERALDAARKGLPPDSPLLKGLQMTLDGARDLLRREGVRPIESMGRKFDPGLHEAVCFMPDPVKPEYIIVEEVQRGYTLDGKVLRASKVSVVTRPAPPCGMDVNEDGNKSKEFK